MDADAITVTTSHSGYISECPGLMVAFGVPVKVNVELVLAQIVVGLNAADAVGSITVKVTV